MQRHFGAHRPESWITVVLVAHLEIDEDVGHRLDKTAQAGQFFEFDVGAVDPKPFQRFTKVVKILCGKRFVEKQQLAEFLHGFQSRHNLQNVGHKPHVFHGFRPLRTQAVVQNQPPNGVKTDFFLKIFRIEHINFVSFKMAAKILFLGNRQ